ncbi:hypothetical protein FALBO_13229 [Fusarium albosuccineum]|uniref:Uncharacterized protein n=1 Tax=Fusarium albosuccineum TaxID=1237068 RepID=A0A8H4L0E8_9HYPO|nr:hypothetical protein FALBO_13229 [Fusarium albosuccineum]
MPSPRPRKRRRPSKRPRCDLKRPLRARQTLRWVEVYDKIDPEAIDIIEPWTQLPSTPHTHRIMSRNNLGTIAKSAQFSVRAVKTAKEPSEDNLEDNVKLQRAVHSVGSWPG